MKLNARGQVVVWTLAICIATIFTVATHDLCYIGDGYGSCDKMLDEVVSK
jgi:hypothetical protein